MRASDRAAYRRSSRRRGALERILGALVLVAAAAALAAGAALFLPSLFRITRYEIVGASAMTREEVLSAALVHEREYLFSIEPARVREALEADPRVARAEATRLFPNGLRIAVTERKPVAAVLVEAAGGQRLAYLDAEGVAFALAYPDAAAGSAAAGSATAYPSPEGLPVLSGIRIENFRVGARLPAQLTAILAALGRIESAEPALLAAFSEIRIARSRFGETELLLYPLRQRVRVRASSSLSVQDLRSIILVLDVLRSGGLGASVSEIDFRTGTVVYRGKEGQSD